MRTLLNLVVADAKGQDWNPGPHPTERPGWDQLVGHHARAKVRDTRVLRLPETFWPRKQKYVKQKEFPDDEVIPKTARMKSKGAPSSCIPDGKERLDPPVLR